MKEILSDIERTEINQEEIVNFSSEREFTYLAFCMFREAASYVCVAACTLGPSPTWDRDQAIISGNMVRLYKLLSAFLDQTTQDRREVADILGRLAFETVVNLQYLISNFSPDLAENYVRYSLRHERKLWDIIQNNIAEREGEILPVERRMLRSLERTSRMSGIPLEDINPKEKFPWGKKNLYQKAEAVGLDEAYIAMFGGSSHYIHGNWQDLYTNHLEVNDEGEFTPKLDWGHIRPHLLFALGLVVIDTVHEFFKFLNNKCALEELDNITNRLTDLYKRMDMVNEAHETYLSSREWPKI